VLFHIFIAIFRRAIGFLDLSSKVYCFTARSFNYSGEYSSPLNDHCFVGEGTIIALSGKIWLRKKFRWNTVVDRDFFQLTTNTVHRTWIESHESCFSSWASFELRNIILIGGQSYHLRYIRVPSNTYQVEAFLPKKTRCVSSLSLSPWQESSLSAHALFCGL
jgi:hypothetical protein